MSARAPATLLIAFVDLNRFSAQSRRVEDTDLAEVIDSYYERVAARVTAGGGRVVKFMGDGALAVFPEDGVDAGVNALLALKEEIFKKHTAPITYIRTEDPHRLRWDKR